MTAWGQSQKGKEVFLYRFYDFEVLPPVSLGWNLAPVGIIASSLQMRKLRYKEATC